VRTALDSSVILDVVLNDPTFADASERAIRRAAGEGSLAVCETVLAEVRPAFAAGDLEQFLTDLEISFVPSTKASSVLAGEMFGVYLKRRHAGRRRVVADFLIGAHAMVCADRLLARDLGYFRGYFKNLKLLEP
jgi:predicted nucleic acid-binding protein